MKDARPGGKRRLSGGPIAGLPVTGLQNGPITGRARPERTAPTIVRRYLQADRYTGFLNEPYDAGALLPRGQGAASNHDFILGHGLRRLVAVDLYDPLFRLVTEGELGWSRRYLLTTGRRR